METQQSYYYPFEQGSKPRFIPGQRPGWLSAASRMAAPGPADMMVTLSDQSTHSTRSGYTDATDRSVLSLSTMASSYDDPATLDYEMGHSPSYVPVHSAASSFGARSYGQASPASYGQYELGRHEAGRRETPSSLGWTSDYVLVELYNFVVIKGKEPYLELLPEYTVTPETPERVYLDPPKNAPKGVYPCQFPGCHTKKPSNRPADLERHYRNVHASADQKERYQCDYPKCERSTDPFTRKDHYRDHLRDYHKEDLGQAKRAKRGDERDWERAQESWLSERNISASWWRCAKCLSRVRVDENGWECGRCQATCEADRAQRRHMKREEHSSHSHSHSHEYSTTADPMSSCTACNGAYYIPHPDGNYTACPRCELRTAPQFYDHSMSDSLGYEMGYDEMSYSTY